MYILKLGELYIARISIENYDSDISIEFTINIDDAKNFNELNYLTFKNLIELLLNCELKIICVNNDCDKNL